MRPAPLMSGGRSADADGGAAPSPTPARVVAYPLAVLRQSENGSPPWATGLARAVDVRSGLAAVVGVNHLGGDWVYLIIDQPAEPTTFKAVVGWARRGPND